MKLIIKGDFNHNFPTEKFEEFDPGCLISSTEVQLDIKDKSVVEVMEFISYIYLEDRCISYNGINLVMNLT
jgi:hypothetical protein